MNFSYSHNSQGKGAKTVHLCMNEEWRTRTTFRACLVTKAVCTEKKNNGAMSFHNVSKKKYVLGSVLGGFILIWGTMSASVKHILKALWQKEAKYFEIWLKLSTSLPQQNAKNKICALIHYWQKQLAWTPYAESIHFSISTHCHWAISGAKIFSFWNYHQLQQPCDMLGQNFDPVWRLCEAQFSLIQFASHSKCESISILEFKKTHCFWIISNKDSQDRSIF